MESVRDRGGGRGSFESIVIGVPGRVDYCAGRLEHAPNLPSTWRDELTERKLAGHFDAPVFLANDADLAAVGEAYFGAGRPYTDMVYVTISTGIGAGVVLDGRLLRGTRSLAEIGHTVLALDHLNAGEPATAEELAAGPALDRNANRVGITARGADLVSLVEGGNRRASRAWDETMRAAGAAVVNLAHLFSPDVIVVGGGVGRNGTLVHDPVTDMLEQHGPQGLDVPIAVVEAVLGDDPGLVGGAAWPLAVGAC
jgi:glucokinase